MMASDLNFVDGLLPTCLLRSLNQLRLAGVLCDVRLRVGDQELSAHRAVLAAASPYFRLMFTSNLREAREECVSMQGVEYSIVNDVVNFIYTTEIEVTEENVFSLIDIADFLQMPSIRTACSHYLMESLSTSNSLAVLQAIQRRCGYRDLERAAMRFTRKHFSQVVESQDFALVSADVLLTIIQGRVLNVPDEGFVLKAVVSWVSINPEERVEHLDTLASSTYLMQVPMEVLVNIKQNPIIENSNLHRQIKNTINTILEERYDMEFRTIWATNYREKMRRMLRYYDDQEVILALGGESNGMALESVECFTLGYDTWKCSIPTAVTHAGGQCEDSKVIPTMCTARCFFGVAHRDDKVFVVGGSTPADATSSAEVFSIHRNEWTSLIPLPIGVAGTRAAFLEDQLHVTGGQSQHRTEKRGWYLDEKSSVWKEFPSMTTPRAFHGLVTVGGCLYAIGGKTDGGCVLNSVERYDPAAECWYKVSSMHDARFDFGCAAVDNYIYIMGGMNGTIWLRSVERYNTLTNQWCFMTPMSVARASFGVGVSDSRLYCLGGYDGIHYLNTVEKFNPRTNRWHCVHAMQRRRYGVGAATLRIPVISKEEP